MFRKIRLTVKAENLSEVMKKLDLPPKYLDNISYTVEVDVKDSKENYNYLATSGEVLDWEPLLSEPEIYEPEVTGPEIIEDYPEPKDTDILTYLGRNVTTKEDLFKVLFFISVDLQRPGGGHEILGVPYLEQVFTKYQPTKTKVTENAALLDKFCFDQYYQDTDFSDCLNNVCDLLLQKWTEVISRRIGESKATLFEVLFGNSPKIQEVREDFERVENLVYAQNIIDIYELLGSYGMSGENIEELVHLLHASWKLLQKSPGFRFTPEVVQNYILNTPKHEIFYDEMEYYVRILEDWGRTLQGLSDCLPALLAIMSDNWKTIGDYQDFATLVRTLFKVQ